MTFSLSSADPTILRSQKMLGQPNTRYRVKKFAELGATDATLAIEMLGQRALCASTAVKAPALSMPTGRTPDGSRKSLTAPRRQVDARNGHTLAPPAETRTATK
jgi:hypothetical protein